eukprot:CAMPEP_0206151252 /NCGR_PEP_ID=MMETSP1473-20131121/38722_1 /ASSEMBLY_ACC=CAM_ASM_001109 /TAXON_ID=1461547 /ORGANISM="Stichococcus sp, Strain RCC1054" /LENGTH=734 /DNA_ID=CAMNT_0053548791 /DNA_START=552 /DNA_END=2756 /DNA_ORIENTATION=+
MDAAAAAIGTAAGNGSQSERPAAKGRTPVKYVPPATKLSVHNPANPNFKPRVAHPDFKYQIKYPSNPPPPGTHRFADLAAQSQQQQQQQRQFWHFTTGAPPARQSKTWHRSEALAAAPPLTDRAGASEPSGNVRSRAHDQGPDSFRRKMHSEQLNAAPSSRQQSVNPYGGGAGVASSFAAKSLGRVANANAARLVTAPAQKSSAAAVMRSSTGSFTSGFLSTGMNVASAAAASVPLKGAQRSLPFSLASSPADLAEREPAARHVPPPVQRSAMYADAPAASGPAATTTALAATPAAAQQLFKTGFQLGQVATRATTHRQAKAFANTVAEAPDDEHEEMFEGFHASIKRQLAMQNVDEARAAQLQQYIDIAARAVREAATPTPLVDAAHNSSRPSSRDLGTVHADDGHPKSVSGGGHRGPQNWRSNSIDHRTQPLSNIELRSEFNDPRSHSNEEKPSFAQWDHGREASRHGSQRDSSSASDGDDEMGQGHSGWRHVTVSGVVQPPHPRAGNLGNGSSARSKSQRDIDREVGNCLKRAAHSAIFRKRKLGSDEVASHREKSGSGGSVHMDTRLPTHTGTGRAVDSLTPHEYANWKKQQLFRLAKESREPDAKVQQRPSAPLKASGFVAPKTIGLVPKQQQPKQQSKQPKQQPRQQPKQQSKQQSLSTRAPVDVAQKLGMSLDSIAKAKVTTAQPPTKKGKTVTSQAPQKGSSTNQQLTQRAQPILSGKHKPITFIL